jgi:hypothetical protein
MKFGDDKALSMGGSLPGEVANGLVSVYDRLRKTGNPVFVAAVFEVDYVKTYPHGDKPDEPVLKLVRVEVGQGADEQALHEMIDRLSAARNGEPTLTSVQGELPVGAET